MATSISDQKVYLAIFDGTQYDPTNYLHLLALKRGIGELVGGDLSWIVPTPKALERRWFG